MLLTASIKKKTENERRMRISSAYIFSKSFGGKIKPGQTDVNKEKNLAKKTPSWNKIKFASCFFNILKWKDFLVLWWKFMIILFTESRLSEKSTLELRPCAII